MKTRLKMNFTIKGPLNFGLVIGLLLLTMQCDKITYVDFKTKNNFVLNASNHEFDVITKIETYINSITINGKSGGTNSPNILNYDTIINFDGYSVRFTKLFDTHPVFGEHPSYPVEIIGEWFTIKKPDPLSTVMQLFIDENNIYSERNLAIHISGAAPGIIIGEVTIKQKSRN